MSRQRFFEVFGGLVVALLGIALLARVDFPYIVNGGWPAVLASLELSLAILLVSIALGASGFRK